MADALGLDRKSCSCSLNPRGFDVDSHKARLDLQQQLLSLDLQQQQLSLIGGLDLVAYINRICDEGSLVGLSSRRCTPPSHRFDVSRTE